MAQFCTSCRHFANEWTVSNGNLICKDCFSSKGSSSVALVPGTELIAKLPQTIPLF